MRQPQRIMMNDKEMRQNTMLNIFMTGSQEVTSSILTNSIILRYNDLQKILPPNFRG
jgi:hypothetical protein